MLNNLTDEEMIKTTGQLLAKDRKRPLLESHPLLLAMLPALSEAPTVTLCVIQPVYTAPPRADEASERARAGVGGVLPSRLVDDLTDRLSDGRRALDAAVLSG